MPKDITNLFTSLGLSASETKIYLASLELGPTSVQDIAKKAKLSRTAAYDAIESLQMRGLMSTFERAKKKFFTAEDPETVAAHFKENVIQMQDQLEVLNRAIPEIKMMAGGERPAVRFYEGKEALYALFADIAKAEPKTMDELSNMDDIEEYMDPKVLTDARKTYDAKRTKTRVLHRGKAPEPKPYREYCELKKDVYADFHGDIMIYGNRVAFLSYVGKVIAAIVESDVFADTARVLFEAAWKTCKKK